MRTWISGTVLAVAVLPLAACSSDDVSVDELRAAAEDAGDAPTECPVDLDVAGALDQAGVKVGDVTVEVSSTTEPADDPLAAQQDGMSPLDAAAGVYIACDYTIEAGDLHLYVVATEAEEAAPLVLLPQLGADADLTVDQLQDLADDVETGSTTIAPGGTAALAVVPVDGDGSVAVMVTGDAVSEDDLERVVDDLVGDLRPS